MKTFLLMLSIKLLVIFPMAQQPDSSDRSRTGKANTARAKAIGKPVKGKAGISGGLLYRIPLSI